MQAIVEILQSAGVFLGGMLARVGIFLAMVAVLVLPALAIALTLRAVAAQRRRALGLRRVAGLLFRPDLLYAPCHVWLRPRSRAGTLELGIDDLAQRLLPSVTDIELPVPGTAVARGDTVAKLHGGGWVLPIPAPIAGTVAGVNAAVLRDPALVKRDGYRRGWLVAIAAADRSTPGLRQGAEAESWLQRESARWSRFVEERLGFAAADGGELVAPAPWLVGAEGWRELASAFLRG